MRSIEVVQDKVETAAVAMEESREDSQSFDYVEDETFSYVRSSSGGDSSFQSFASYSSAADSSSSSSSHEFSPLYGDGTDDDDDNMEDETALNEARSFSDGKETEDSVSDGE